MYKLGKGFAQILCSLPGAVSIICSLLVDSWQRAHAWQVTFVSVSDCERQQQQTKVLADAGHREWQQQLQPLLDTGRSWGVWGLSPLPSQPPLPATPGNPYPNPWPLPRDTPAPAKLPIPNMHLLGPCQDPLLVPEQCPCLSHPGVVIWAAEQAVLVALGLLLPALQKVLVLWTHVAANPFMLKVELQMTKQGQSLCYAFTGRSLCTHCAHTIALAHLFLVKEGHVCIFRQG